MTALAQQVGVLAHGGGAPEAAMIGLPLVVLAVFAVLERRARRREAGQELREAEQELREAEQQLREAEHELQEPADERGTGDA